MAKIIFFVGNMEPVSTAEEADKMQVVLGDASVAVQASRIYGQWHRSVTSLPGSSELGDLAETEAALRDWVDVFNRQIPGEAGAEEFLEAHPDIERKYRG